MEEFKKIEMTTLVNCTNNLTAEGYTENFMAKENGLEAQSSQRIYKPCDIKINSFYRFEGESDPADNSILYAIETCDGVKGMLIDAYGAYANPLISKFISDVGEIEKKAHVHRNVTKIVGTAKKLFNAAKRMLWSEPKVKAVVTGLLIAAGLMLLAKTVISAKPKSLLNRIHLN